MNLHAAGGRGYGQVPSSDPLLEGGGGVPEPRFNRRELPPKLVDSAEEAHENFKVIQRKLVDLKKAQQRRLLKVFQSGDLRAQRMNTSSPLTAVERCTPRFQEAESTGTF